MADKYSVAKTTHNGRRTNGVNHLPQATNDAARDRLLLLRRARQVDRTEIEATKILSASTLAKYELHDLSSCKLGDMAALAQFYNMSFVEFMAYLFDGAPLADVSTIDRLATDIAVQLRALSPADQELVANVVRTIVDTRLSID